MMKLTQTLLKTLSVLLRLILAATPNHQSVREAEALINQVPATLTPTLPPTTIQLSTFNLMKMNKWKNGLQDVLFPAS